VNTGLAHKVHASLRRPTTTHRLHPPSVRLMGQLRTLAARYPRSKFTAIVGDKCIPNYPDNRLPTLILYRGGVIKEQLVAWGAKVEGSLEGEFLGFSDTNLC